MKPLVLASLLVLAVAPAKAENFMAGIGVNTCSTYIGDLKADPKTELEYYNWAIAFMSGLNTMMRSLKNTTVDLELVSVAQTTAFMRKHCEANPSVWVADAAANMWGELQQRLRK